MLKDMDLRFPLPATIRLSSFCVPTQELMTSPASPILDFYPGAFSVDMEGKRAEWEGIVLIPFIDEACLLAAEGRIPRGALTPEERSRNAPGDILIYSHDPAAGPEGAQYKNPLCNMQATML